MWDYFLWFGCYVGCVVENYEELAGLVLGWKSIFGSFYEMEVYSVLIEPIIFYVGKMGEWVGLEVRW